MSIHRLELQVFIAEIGESEMARRYDLALALHELPGARPQLRAVRPVEKNHAAPE